MFSEWLNEAYNAKNEIQLQEIVLRISSEAIHNGLSFKEKLQTQRLVLELSSKYKQFKDTSSHLMEIILQCETIPPGNNTSYYLLQENYLLFFLYLQIMVKQKHLQS